MAGLVFDLAEVEFAGAEEGEGGDWEKGVGLGFPEVGEVAGGEFSEAGGEVGGVESVEDDEAFAFFFIGDAGDDEGWFGAVGEFVQFFLDFDVGHHFAADFAEAIEAVGDLEEAVFIEGGDVAGAIPALVEDFGGFFGAVEVAAHDVGAADEHEAGLAEGDVGFAVGLVDGDDADADAGEGMADGAAFGADLTEAGGAVIVGVDADGGGAFGAAVAFEGADAEVFFKGEGEAVGEFFGAGHDEAEAAEIGGGAAAQIDLEEGGGGEEEGDGVFADEDADGF